MSSFAPLLLFLALADPGPAAIVPGPPMVQESALRGVVVRADLPDRPVPGARVLLTQRGSEATRREVRSDESGRFDLGPRPAGDLVVRVEALGFADAEVGVPAGGAPTLRIALVLRPLLVDGIVTTANPLGSSATYQPQQALGPDDLVRRMDASIGTMLDGEPGLAMRSLGSAPARPVVRGFDGDRLLVLENGERMGDLSESAADHAVALDPMALRRVEIVRGPASLLYGSSALGGVVNLVTADLPEDWRPGLSGTAQTQVASMNRSISAGGDLLVGMERWAATGRISARRSGDLRTPESRLLGTDVLGRDLQVGAVHRRGGLRGGLSFSLVERNYGIPEAPDDPSEEVRIEMGRAALQGRLSWDAEDEAARLRGVEIRLQGARFEQDERERALGPGGALLDEGVPLAFEQRAAFGTATLRHGAVGWMSGGALGISGRQRNLRVGGEDAFTPGVRESALSLFAFEEVPLGRGLRLQVGGRGELLQSRALPNEAFPTRSAPGTSFARSGSLGLHWRPSPGWEMGVQAARAHRSPTVEERYADGPHLGAGVYEVGRADLAEEIGKGVDLFVRLGWERGGLEATVFRNRIANFVAFEPTGEVDAASGLPVFRYLSTHAEFRGGEITVEVRPGGVVQGLSLGLVVDAVRAERRNRFRDPLPSIPPLRSRLRLRYEGDRGWWAGTTLRAVAAQTRVAPSEDPTEGYLLVDGGAGLLLGSDGRHALILRVDNATNRLYRDHLSRVEERGYPMPARNISLVYRWSF